MTSPDIITLPTNNNHSLDSPNYYYEQLVALALQKTEQQYGKTQIRFYPLNVGHERQRAIITGHAGLDVMWSSTSPLRETNLLAVKFNLLRGLSDYKLIIIRREDEAKFAAVHTLVDLRQFSVGTGIHWWDTEVFKTNDMPMVTFYNSDPLFKMLAAKRFDYARQGIHEIWNEMTDQDKKKLMIEDHLLIYYPQPIYFFVSKDNPTLAKRLLEGLQMAERDGSLSTLFFSVPNHLQGYTDLNCHRREMLIMKTPDETSASTRVR